MADKTKVPGWDDIVSLWSHGRPASTLYVYLPVIRSFRNYVAEIPPGTVELVDCQGWMNLAAEQLPSTRKRKQSTLRSLFRFAKKVGAITVDPTDALQQPHVPDGLSAKILTRDEVIKLIDTETPGTRDRVLLVILFTCGLRASEASGLRWADCRSRGQDGQISVLGKGNKRRSIRLTPEAWKELMSIQPPNVAGERFVFESDAGFRRPLSRLRIANIVRTAAKKAGLEQAVSPHWLRHTHATEAMNSGAPLHLISYTLGHSNIATTARYLHATPDRSSTQYLTLDRKKRNKTEVLKRLRDMENQ